MTLQSPSIKRHFSRGTRQRKAGFALVVTLSMMVLLVLLAIGLLQISSISLRSSSGSNKMATARANARFAMMMALGELQRTAGNDQVATGNAGLEFKDDPSSPLPNPHLTAVWDSKGGEIDFSAIPANTLTTTTNRPGRTPSYDNSRSPRVLVSGNTSFSGPGPAPINAETPVGPDWIRLVAPTNSGDEDTWAPKEELPDGAFAYAVFDEGVKAKVNQADAFLRTGTAYSFPENPMRAELAQSTGTRLLTDPPLAEILPEMHDKTISTPTLALIPGIRNQPDFKAGRYFHDITTDSVGLLTNSRDGGWRRDLTAALTRQDLDQSNDETGDYRMLFEPATYDASDLAKDNDEGGPSLTDRERMRPTFGIMREYFRYPLDYAGNSLQVRKFTGLQSGIAPIPVRLQIALHPVYHDPNPSDNSTDYQLCLHTSGGFVLWNPYNKPMEIPAGYLMEAQHRSITQYSTAKLFDVQAQVDGQPGWQSLFNLKAGGVDDSSAGTTFKFKTQQAFTIPPGRAVVLSTIPSVWSGKSYVQNVTPSWNPGKGAMFVTHIKVPKTVGVSPPGVQIRVIQGNNKGINDGRMIWLFQGANHGLRHLLANFSENENPPVVQPPVVTSLTPETPINAGVPGFPAILWGYAFKFAEEEMPTRRTAGQTTGTVRWAADYNIRAAETGPIAIGRFSGEWLDSGDGFPQAGNIQGGFLPGDRADEFFDIPGFSDGGTLYGFLGSRLDDGLEQLALFDWPTRNSRITGIPNASHSQISSIAQLADSGVTNGGVNASMIDARYSVPATNQGPTWAIGNSHAPARIAAGEVYAAVTDNNSFFTRHYDYSYLCNEGLYDRYFFSTFPQDSGGYDPASPLPNTRYLPDLPSTAAGQAELTDMHKAASHLTVDGAFNVNSTSTKAWELFLASNFEVPVGDDPSTEGVPYSRHRSPAERAALSETLWDGASGRPSEQAMNGYRRLRHGEIRSIASEIVRQVQLRGPFPSVSAFVNRLRSEKHMLVDRSLSADEQLELRGSGALQAAIDRSQMNQNFGTDPSAVISPGEYDPRLPFREAMDGMRDEGVPGFLTQGQMLRKLDPFITVRSDTFRIRSYGEARSASGTVTAKARCEVVVQRTKDYLVRDGAAGNLPTDEGSTLNEINKKFGRRFEIVSFRWLTSDAP